MKRYFYCVDDNGNRYTVPSGRRESVPFVVVELPIDLAHENAEDLIVTTTTDEEGFETVTVTIDEQKKSARLAQESVELTKNLWRQMREERNKRLKETDFMVLPDVPVEDLEAVKTYRQALRDLPDTITDITSFEWPELKIKENI